MGCSLADNAPWMTVLGSVHDLVQTGAVPLRVGRDVRIESPGYDPFPQRDLGWDAYAQSRAQIELSVRQRLRAYANIELRQRCRVQECVARADGAALTGVQCVLADGKSETVEADLVIDASGRGTLTLGLLKASGWALPAETTIGVDLGYATAVFAMPEDAPEDWKGVFCFPRPPRSNFGALLCPWKGALDYHYRQAARRGAAGDADGSCLYPAVAHPDDIQCTHTRQATGRDCPLSVSGRVSTGITSSLRLFQEASYL
jgi:2-polyprenyl-6-methoxyphenol hydroxylase-like FAD-dependent oxidoreductase